MEDGDLGTWDQKRIMLVLEETCCHINWQRSGLLKSRMEPTDPENWNWGLTTIKSIQRYAYNTIPVELITFTSPEIAGLAAQWCTKYDVEVASVDFYDFRQFTRSLLWRRNNIQEVIEANQDRLVHYGQLGRSIVFDGEF